MGEHSCPTSSRRLAEKRPITMRSTEVAESSVFEMENQLPRLGYRRRYFATVHGLNLDRETVGKFIDACVQNRVEAKRLLNLHPELRNATWLGDEHLLNFLAIENFTDGVRFCLENGFDANEPDGEFEGHLCTMRVNSTISRLRRYYWNTALIRTRFHRLMTRPFTAALVTETQK